MIEHLEQYLKEHIDDEIVIEKYNNDNIFPVYLKSIYSFYAMEILDIDCLLLEIIDEAPRADFITKHLNRIRSITDKQVVLFYKEITNYRKKSLMDQKIPFVVEDGQMYLPFIGLHFKSAVVKETIEVNSFTPSAQVAFLYFLYNQNLIINSTDFSKIFGWNKMRTSRALNELFDAKILTYNIGGKTGRSKEYRVINKLDYFKKGNEFFDTPIKDIVYVKRAPKDSCIAGLQALSNFSMLNPPNYLVRAIGADNFNKENLDIIDNKDIIKDEDSLELQIWKYDPRLFTSNNVVDKASLYLSLKHETDERVEQALKYMLQGEQWYMD